MFWIKHVYPCISQIYYGIKMGFKGVYISCYPEKVIVGLRRDDIKLEGDLIDNYENVLF